MKLLSPLLQWHRSTVAPVRIESWFHKSAPDVTQRACGGSRVVRIDDKPIAITISTNLESTCH